MASTSVSTTPIDFNPRPPRGERRRQRRDHKADHHISIHALREESDFGRSTFQRRPCSISIHALREESDHDHSP